MEIADLLLFVLLREYYPFSKVLLKFFTVLFLFLSQSKKDKIIDQIIV